MITWSDTFSVITFATIDFYRKEMNIKHNKVQIVANNAYSLFA
jgi:hypothetical protein